LSGARREIGEIVFDAIQIFGFHEHSGLSKGEHYIAPLTEL